MTKKITKQLQAKLEDAEDLYNQKAAAMIPYPVDIYGKIIDVPEDEIDKANASLMVQHLIGRGFEIVAVPKGSIIKKQVFNPKINTTTKKQKEEATEDVFILIGNKFQIVASGVIGEVIEVRSEKATLKYLGQFHTGTPYDISMIKEMLKREAWVRIA